MIEMSSVSEDPLEVTLGLDRGPHDEGLVGDGKPLATLGTTTRENRATSLTCHTGTEAMALRTLTLIGLIGTLHGKFLLKKTNRRSNGIALRL